jgi:hypothetical protein
MQLSASEPSTSLPQIRPLRGEIALGVERVDLFASIFALDLDKRRGHATRGVLTLGRRRSNKHSALLQSQATRSCRQMVRNASLGDLDAVIVRGGTSRTWF